MSFWSPNKFEMNGGHLRILRLCNKALCRASDHCDALCLWHLKLPRTHPNERSVEGIIMANKCCLYMLCDCLIKLIPYIIDMFFMHMAYDVCVIMFPEKNLSLIPVSTIDFSQSEVVSCSYHLIHIFCHIELSIPVTSWYLLNRWSYSYILTKLTLMCTSIPCIY